MDDDPYGYLHQKRAKMKFTPVSRAEYFARIAQQGKAGLVGFSLAERPVFSYIELTDYPPLIPPC